MTNTLYIFNAHNGATYQVAKPVRFASLQQFKFHLHQHAVQEVVGVEDLILLTSFGIKLEFPMVNELQELFLFDRRLFQKNASPSILAAYLAQEHLRHVAKPVAGAVPAAALVTELNRATAQLNVMFRALNIIFQFASNFIFAAEKAFENYSHEFRLLQAKSLHKSWRKLYADLQALPAIHFKNSAPLRLADLLSVSVLSDASKAVDAHLPAMVQTNNEMSGKVQAMNRVKVEIDDEIAMLRKASVQKFQAKAEVVAQVEAQAQGKDKHGEKLLSAAQAQAKDKHGEKLLSAALECYGLLQSAIGFKAHMVEVCSDIWQQIAQVQMMSVEVKSGCKRLFEKDDTELARMREHEAILSMTIDLPLLFGFILIERRRQFEWADYFSKGVVRSASEQLSTLIEHEKKFQALWNKRFGALLKSLDPGVSMQAQVPAVDVTIVNTAPKAAFGWLDFHIERDDLTRFIDAMRPHQPEKSTGLLERNFKDLVSSTDRLKSATKILMTLSTTAEYDAQSQIIRARAADDSDLSQMRGLRCRIKKLEDLLHQQQYKNLHGWPVVRGAGVASVLYDHKLAETDHKMAETDHRSDQTESFPHRSDQTESSHKSAQIEASPHHKLGGRGQPHIQESRPKVTHHVSEPNNPIKLLAQDKKPLREALDASETIDKHLEILRLKRTVKEMQAKLDASERTKREHEELKERHVLLEGKCSNLEKSREALEGSFEELKKSHEELKRSREIQDRYEDLEQSHQDLKRRNESLEKSHEDLKIRNESLEKGHEDLKIRNESLEKSHEDLKIRNESLEKSHEDLKIRNESLEKSHEDLKIRNESLQKSHEDLQRNHEGLGQNNDILKKNHEDLKGTYYNLERSHDNLKQSHENLKHVHRHLEEDYKRLGDSKKPPESYNDMEPNMESIVSINLSRSSDMQSVHHMSHGQTPEGAVAKSLEGLSQEDVESIQRQSQAQTPSQAQAALEDANSKLKSEKSALESKVSDLESAKSALESKVSDLESAKSSLESKVSDLESAKSALESKVSDLESEISALESKVSDLESAKSALESNVSDLESAKSALESNVSDLESAKSALTSNVSDLESAKSALTSNVSDLNSLNSELLSNMRAKEAEFRTERSLLSDQLSQLLAQHDEARAKLDAKTEDFEALMEVMQSKSQRMDELMHGANKTTRSMFASVERLIASNMAFFYEFCEILEGMGLLLVAETNMGQSELRIRRVKGLRSKREHSAAHEVDVSGTIKTFRSAVVADMAQRFSWARELPRLHADAEDGDMLETQVRGNVATCEEYLGRVDQFVSAMSFRSEDDPAGPGSEPFFLNAILKRFRDVEGFAKKLTRESRNSDKISVNNFQLGDLALFLPTKKGSDKVSPWAAFNLDAPHYFLQTSEELSNKEYVLSRISRIDEHVVVDENDNPYELAKGLRWYSVWV